MLSIALLATLVGFGLLVFALVTANLGLAIACVVVCAVGLVLLLIDTVRANRRGRAGTDDEPLFTIRGRESATRAEPLESDEDDTVADRSGAEQDAVNPSTSGLGSLVAPEVQQPASEWSDTSADDEREHPGTGGFQAPSHADPASFDAPQFTTPDTLSAGFQAVDPAAGQAVEGDANDYIRSVTGSFPAQSPPSHETSPGTGGFAAPPAQAGAGTGATESGAFDTGAFDADPVTPATGFPAASGAESADPYVGRRRLVGEGDDAIYVQESDSGLPAMQFKYDHADDKPDGEQPKG